MLRFLATRSWPKKLIAAVAVAAVAQGTAGNLLAQVNGRLISKQVAQQYGLQRAWFSRAEVNPARNYVVSWILADDQLLILTSAGVVQAMDAHTGHTDWIAPIGNPDHPSLGPAASRGLVALVNGSTLHVLDRRNGRPIAQWRLGGAPGAGPALTRHFAFVPLVSGRMEAYPLNEDSRQPWFYQSFGRTLVTPLATDNNVVWTTDTGYLYVANASVPTVRFRLETPSEFLAPPASRGQMIYAISLFGELYAVDGRTGSRRWRYATGYPTDRAPAVVGNQVFVSSGRPALHCVDAATGIGYWEADNVVQFAAASKKHVYGVDPYGTIVLLDRSTGDVVGRIPTRGSINALVNDQTDRLYLLSGNGLVQCLHELELEKPLDHKAPPSVEAAPPEEEATVVEEPSEERSTRDEEAQPPAAGPPAEEEGSPFEGFGTEPSPAPTSRPEEEPEEESPFGVDEDNPFAY